MTWAGSAGNPGRSLSGMMVAITDNQVTQRLLARLIEDQEFPGKPELLAQVTHASVIGGPITFRHLDVDRSVAPSSPIIGSKVPGQAWVVDETGTTLGTLIVWVEDGYLSGLEYGWVTDDPPDNLPAPSQISRRT